MLRRWGNDPNIEACSEARSEWAPGEGRATRASVLETPDCSSGSSASAWPPAQAGGVW